MWRNFVYGLNLHVPSGDITNHENCLEIIYFLYILSKKKEEGHALGGLHPAGQLI